MTDQRPWWERVQHYQERGEAETDPEILDMADTLQPQLARMQTRKGNDDGEMEYRDLIAVIGQCAVVLVEAWIEREKRDG